MKKLLLLFLLLVQALAVMSQDMMIYGYNPEIKRYSVFLGKLTAEAGDTTSVWNTECRYGDKKSDVSIWNVRGVYGSDTSNFSPFNEDADFPPRVTDAAHNVYGYFTTDIDRRERCNFDLTDVICKYHNQIVVNVKKWYRLLFKE